MHLKELENTKGSLLERTFHSEIKKVLITMETEQKVGSHRNRASGALCAWRNSPEIFIVNRNVMSWFR